MIFLVSCTKISNQNFNEIYIDNGKNLIKIKVEIADDNEERSKGLMLREKLDENSGMFFVHRKSKIFECAQKCKSFLTFEKEQEQIFWMKNTLIPLDIIFIDKNFKIIDIKNAVPCKENPCVLYKSSKPAMYVLEVNGNFTVRNDVKIGDKIITNKKY